jgi:hypothetical protein
VTVPPLSPGEYAEEVREALADLPAADREALLEDLDDHLAEVAAEPGMTLEDRLGPPEEYAAELRAAYGGRPAARPRRMTDRVRTRVSRVLRTAHARSLRLVPYRQAVAFAPELRPAWWVLRGYVIALFLLAGVGPNRLTPGDLAAWAFTLAVVWASVWAGRRSAPGMRAWGKGLLGAGNALAAIVLLGALADPPVQAEEGSVTFATGVQYGMAEPYGVRIENVAAGPGDSGVYNIVPYSEDGTPLRNVRLYDQNGRPIVTDPEMYGQSVVIPCDGEPPMRNSYPLQLRPSEEMPGSGMLSPDAAPACVVPSLSPMSPSTSASPSALPTPGPSKTPGPSLTPGPLPEPSGTPSAASPSAPQPDRE